MNLNNLFTDRSTTVTTPKAVTSRSIFAGLFGTQSKAGVHVTLDIAEKHTTVMACYRVLSESMASMPLHLMKRTSKDGVTHKERDYNHPLYNLLSLKANDEMTRFSWMEAMMMNVVSRGKGFSQIIRNNRGRIIALYPLLSDNMEIVRSESGRLGYKYTTKDGDVWLDKEEILHIPGMSIDGINGMSPIAYSANTIGLSIAMEEFGSNFFQNGANPGAVYEIPTSLSDSAFDRLRASLKEKYEGLKNTGKPMLLEEGLTFKQIGVSNNDSQFLESRKFQKSEIASIFRIPPHLIKKKKKATFTNIEQQSLEFVTFTLTPWVQRFEQALNVALFGDDTTHYVSFNMDAMIRGDIKNRYDANGAAIRDGWKTRNEVRLQEGLNPLDGLDEPVLPLNMTQGDANAKTK